jgi:hypothetical protein
MFALWLQKIALWLQTIELWLQTIALWLQKIALLFGINCTEINQSQSSNIFMYIISIIILHPYNNNPYHGIVSTYLLFYLFTMYSLYNHITI